MESPRPPPPHTAGTRRTNSEHKTSRYRPGRPFRHKRRNAANQLHAQNKPISPRPLPPQTPERGKPTPCTKQADIARPVPPQPPERGGPTPSTKQADIAPAPTATNAGTRQSNGLANLNGIPPATSATLTPPPVTPAPPPVTPAPNPIRPPTPPPVIPANRESPPRSATNLNAKPRKPQAATTRQSNGLANLNGIAPSPTATNAGTRRSNSIHKTSRYRPAHSATHAGTRRTNSMHKTSRYRPDRPFRHKRRNAAI